MKLFVTLSMIALSLVGCESSIAPDPQQNALPRPLTQSEPVLADGGACAAGGLRLYHGLDYDGDGRLGAYERHRAEIICNPIPLGGASATGVALGKPKRPRPDDG